MSINDGMWKLERNYVGDFMRMRRSLLMALLSLFFVAVFLSSCSKGKPRTDISRDYEGTVDVRMIDKGDSAYIIYRIPKKYVPYWKRRTGQITKNYVKIETGLPEFEVRPAKTKIVGEPGSDQYLESLEKFNNGVFIYLDNEKSIPDFGKNLRNSIERRRKKNPSNIEGLDLYKGDGGCSKKDCYGDILEYYLSSKMNDYPHWVEFQCVPKNPLSGCTAVAEYRGWVFKYSIRRSQLHRWQELDSKIREFLDRMYLKDGVL